MATIAKKLKAQLAAEKIEAKLPSQKLANKLLDKFMSRVLDAIEDVPEEEKPAYIRQALLKLDAALDARTRPFLIKR
jgi:hypothetical protein